MRKLLLFIAASLSMMSAKAQNFFISTFDTLSLPQPDTFYVNYSAPGTDVGFWDGALYFPCVYDTSFGYEFWSTGFVYSNMTDSVTSGFGNQYSAKTGIGHDSSSQYGVAYGQSTTVHLNRSVGPTVPMGFFITNTTYVHNSLRDGDGFAKKFGGVTGDDPDWFKLVVRGYLFGVEKPDSVEFYLADFRDNNNANDYIVNSWQWVDLAKFGITDSLKFELFSSDNGPFGMNTPAYFALDDFEVGLAEAVAGVPPYDVKVFPNPATNFVQVELADPGQASLRVTDMMGRTVAATKATGPKARVDVSGLANGHYLLQIAQGESVAVVRFQKQ